MIDMNKGIARKKDGHILIIKGPSNVNQNGQYCNISIVTYFISSAVPSGSGAFQMPTRPLSAEAASTLRGGGGGPISETLQ